MNPVTARALESLRLIVATNESAGISVEAAHAVLIQIEEQQRRIDGQNRLSAILAESCEQFRMGGHMMGETLRHHEAELERLKNAYKLLESVHSSLINEHADLRHHQTSLSVELQFFKDRCDALQLQLSEFQTCIPDWTAEPDG